MFAAKIGGAILLAAGLARLTWYALDSFSILPAAPPPKPPAVAQNRPTTPPPDNRTTAQPTKPRAPRGNEDLVLTGIMKTGSAGAAIMRVNSQPETAFVVGQQILPSIVLHAVMANRVLIMNDGVLESLTLTGKRTQLTLPEEEKASKSFDSISMAAENHYLIPRKLIETNVINPQALLSGSAVTPTPDGGLLVQAVEAGSVYEKLGVRAGDVVRSANEHPLGTVQDAMQVYYGLQNNGGTGDIRLEIIRKGEPLYLQYTIQ